MAASVSFEVASIRGRAAWVRRPDRRTLALTGPDRVRFLNGMVTHDVAALAPGQGTLAVKTSAKGRTEALVRIRAEAERLLIDCAAIRAERLLETLDRYIVMDDCAIADVSGEARVITVLGPQARAILGRTHLGDPGAIAPQAFRALRGSIVVADGEAGVPAFEVHLPPFAEAGFVEELTRAGAEAVSLAALDVVRVEAGRPIDGHELDDEVIPLEAGLERAIHFHKGCYIGQEVIARATNLGGVRHALVGVSVGGPRSLEDGGPGSLEGEARLAGAALWAEGRASGELTSVVRSPTLGRVIGLGYVRREHAAPGTALELRDADGNVLGTGEVHALPFVADA